MVPKIKMAANLEFLLTFYTDWFMLIVLVLYFMRLHFLKQEKRKKIVFKFKMALESKMDAEICFRHSVYRISSFSKRFFVFPFFYYN
jgi:hypothetical protein